MLAQGPSARVSKRQFCVVRLRVSSPRAHVAFISALGKGWKGGDPGASSALHLLHLLSHFLTGTEPDTDLPQFLDFLTNNLKPVPSTCELIWEEK